MYSFLSPNTICTCSEYIGTFHAADLGSIARELVRVHNTKTSGILSLLYAEKIAQLELR